MFPGFPRMRNRIQADGPGAGLAAAGLAGGPAAWRKALWSAGRACCCPAKPVVIAVMPPSPARPRAVDLMLCRHHYRASEKALAAAGAVILDPEQWGPEDLASATSPGADELAAARARHPSSSGQIPETPDA